MAAKPTTPPHLFYWTPAFTGQLQTPKSRCNECGSRAGHPVHNFTLDPDREFVWEKSDV